MPTTKKSEPAVKAKAHNNVVATCPVCGYELHTQYLVTHCEHCGYDHTLAAGDRCPNQSCTGVLA